MADRLPSFSLTSYLTVSETIYIFITYLLLFAYYL